MQAAQSNNETKQNPDNYHACSACGNAAGGNFIDKFRM
jgi:hypothetical protein